MKPENIVFKQSDLFENWEYLGILCRGGAPVFIPTDNEGYWLLTETGKYDVLHSWDMESWDLVNEDVYPSWVTSAVIKDGMYYIYYDKMNDADPYLIIDDNLWDRSYVDMGLAFDDPTWGSDAGAFKDENGNVHLFTENWDAVPPGGPPGQHPEIPEPISRYVIDAHWDSQQTEHAVSPNGVAGFSLVWPPLINIDDLLYDGHWMGVGDVSMLQIGDVYHVICDNYVVGPKVGYVSHFVGRDLYETFEPTGKFVDLKGSADPSWGFAENKFWMFWERPPHGIEYARSYGPWVDHVEARVGVDTDGDSIIDEWTEWQTIRDTYSKKLGCARIVERDPASIDLSPLPEGYGFKIEFRMDVYATDAPPRMDRFTLNVRQAAEPEFEFWALSVSKATVGPGEPTEVTVGVMNTGGVEGTCTVELMVDGEVADTETVSLGLDQSTTVTFTVSSEEVGAHTVSVDGLTKNFEVVEQANPGGEVPVLLVAGAIITIVAVAGGAWLWRKSRMSD